MWGEGCRVKGAGCVGDLYGAHGAHGHGAAAGQPPPSGMERSVCIGIASVVEQRGGKKQRLNNTDSPQGLGSRALGFGVRGSGSGVRGLGFKVQGSGFGVWGSGFRVWGSGFGVRGLGFGGLRSGGSEDLDLGFGG